MSEPFLGEISPVAFVFAPKGWAFCNGQLLPINQNQALFSLLGTSFGGNGTTTFALPNLQGRAIVDADTDFVLGQSGGSESVALAPPELAIHSHAPRCSNATGTVQGASGAIWAKTAAANHNVYAGAASADSTMLTGLITPTGGGQPHENRQPFLVLNFIIALQGVFPARS